MSNVNNFRKGAPPGYPVARRAKETKAKRVTVLAMEAGKILEWMGIRAILCEISTAIICLRSVFRDFGRKSGGQIRVFKCTLSPTGNVVQLSPIWSTYPLLDFGPEKMIVVKILPVCPVTLG